MHRMTRQRIWTLTVHHWGKLPAGVRPFRVAGLGIGRDDLPGDYRAYEFEFENPPVREDFLALCRTLPWTQVWEDDLMPVIARSQWPLIDDFHKASDADLHDGEGNRVGKLGVCRGDLYVNPFRAVPLILHDHEKAATRHVPKGRRAEADEALMLNANLARERLMALDGGWTPADIARELRRILEEKGFLKQKRASKPVAALA